MSRTTRHMQSTALRNSHSRAAVLACVVLAFAAGCETVENVSPVEVATTTTPAPTTTGGGGTGGEGGSPGAAPIRTVEQRNPFGNVAATDNLLWDGDFEWSSPFSDQYGWLYGAPFSYAFPAATIGAVCRSGIKCVTLPKNKQLLGVGVGSTSQALQVTAFAKPPTDHPECAGVDVSLLAIESFSDDFVVPPTTELPDSTGWCLYRGTVQSYPKKAYVLIDNNTGGELVVDDVVVRAVPPGDPPAPPAPPPMVPPTAERVARHDEAVAAIRRLRGPHDPPPNPAKRAFQEHHSR